MPIVLNGSGPITGVTSLNTTVSDTEIGYLDGVTSAIQSQINTAGGLVKITDATFSAQSAVNVNNCFSSTYENYLVIFSKVVSTGSISINIRMRASGTDATGTNYAWQNLEANSTTISGSRNTSQTSARIFVGRSDSNGCDTHVNIYRPFQATQTNIVGGITYDSFSGAMVNINVGTHDLSTSYDGFTVFPSSSTITGTLRVYGYRN